MVLQMKLSISGAEITYYVPRNVVDTFSDEAAQVGAGKLLAPLSTRMLSKRETVNLCQNRGVSASVYNFV